MDKFLDAYDLSILNQEEVNCLNRSITSNEIEEVVVSPKKSSGLDRFIAEFFQAFIKELTQILFKLFHKIQREGLLPNSFYEVRIVLRPKPEMDIRKKGIEQFPWLT
jgi:hypothetical protein